MPHRFRGERTLMRIFIGENDRYHGQPLYDALVRFFRDRGCAGATVLRGIAGFGSTSKLRSERTLRLSVDLPIVVEVVESEEAIQEILPDLDRMIDGGLITLEPVRVILYRPADAPDDARARHSIEGLVVDDPRDPPQP